VANVGFDLLLRGGVVYDGTGAQGRVADVAVEGDRVVTVERLPASAEAAVDLDVSGLVVAPGFIDSHSHSDFSALLPQDAEAARLANLRQGVTTDVCGNCGFSPFPVLPDHRADVSRQNESLLGRHATACIGFDEFEELLAGGDRPVNLAALTGHNTLRAGVMGDEDRPASAEELVTMQRLLAGALDAGSVGLSFGLIYPPGCFAGSDELAALAAVAAQRRKPFTTHMRNEASEIGAAIGETLDVAERSGAAAHVSHLKVAGRPNWGRIGAVIERLESARRRGLDVTADAYPYAAGSTGLTAMLPPWLAEGGVASLLARIADVETRDRIRTDVARGVAGWANPVGMDGWDAVVIASAPSAPELEGRTIASLDGDPVDVACNLLLDNDAMVTIVIHAMQEADVRAVLAQPWVAIGSDGIPLPGRPHPRLAGTFARVVGHYSRDEGMFPLATAIRRMTLDTAERFGLHGRGRLAPRAIADLVVFDAATIIDQATYTDPLAPPRGVAHVVVAGRLAVRDGIDTGVRAGRLLRV
jgi:N-acyl-D-amino-acid deacylase